MAAAAIKLFGKQAIASGTAFAKQFGKELGAELKDVVVS